MSNPLIILASSSPARRKLLSRLQLAFEVVSPDIDETPFDNEPPENLVKRLAQEKALKVASLYPKAIIIASDQVAIINNKIEGKPLTTENAIAQLQAVSGKSCVFLNGLSVYSPQTQHMQTRIIPTTVHYKDLSLETIKNYLHKENPLACAGSIKSEGLAVALFQRFEGDDPTALEGLPLIALVEMLEQAGIKII